MNNDDLIYMLVRWRPRLVVLLVILLALLAWTNVPGRPDL